MFRPNVAIFRLVKKERTQKQIHSCIGIDIRTLHMLFYTEYTHNKGG